MLALSSLAFGAVFAFFFTVTDTVAFASPLLPSLIVYSKLSFPLKPLAGVYLILSSSTFTVPWLGFVVDFIVSVSPSASLSFLSTSIVIAVSYSVVALSSFATGAVFCFSFTVTATCAFASPPLPSLIVYSKLSFPLKLLFGLYLTLPFSIFTLPWLGVVADLIVKVSPSASLSFLSTSIVTVVS